MGIGLKAVYWRNFSNVYSHYFSTKNYTYVLKGWTEDKPVGCFCYATVNVLLMIMHIILMLKQLGFWTRTSRQQDALPPVYSQLIDYVSLTIYRLTSIGVVIVVIAITVRHSIEGIYIRENRTSGIWRSDIRWSIFHSLKTKCKKMSSLNDDENVCVGELMHIITQNLSLKVSSPKRCQIIKSRSCNA